MACRSPLAESILRIRLEVGAKSGQREPLRDVVLDISNVDAYSPSSVEQVRHRLRERVLVIEDDPDIGAFERILLERAGFETQIVSTGASGLESAAVFKPAVVLLDVELPDISGLDVCTVIADTSDAFILLVSAHSSEDAILKGLGLGADDYITKPFRANELVARIQSFLRRRERSRRTTVNDAELKLGNSTLIRSAQLLHQGENKVLLTALEFRLMWFFAESESKLLTRAQILERVWNDVSGVPTRVVDVHVAALRKKLADVDADLGICGVRGIGYRLDRRIVKVPSTRYEGFSSVDRAVTETLPSPSRVGS